MKTRTLIVLVFIFSWFNCAKEISNKNADDERTNELINETSPYLLQHARNPVNWKAWNESTLELAKNEKKLIIISVGYSACHWCHVMEEESFKDSLVAQTMNTHFVNIKVDREERPDVDKVYMQAVQLLTGSGGWPLNVVALPDGRPIWGGTYFNKKQWLDILTQINDKYERNPEDFYDVADKLEEGINNVSLVALNTAKAEFTDQFIAEAVGHWKLNFDKEFGGNLDAPKFMMPNNYHFLLRYAYQTNDKPLQDHVENTLTKMAYGGVFDQIEGGFSRYATDRKWHIPHFEKMLYDNAQLVSLYSEAYSLTKKELYKDVVIETLNFIAQDLTTKEGAFYSSLDADSYNDKDNLEEGAYYKWTKKELKQLLNDEYKLFSEYYNVNSYGHWEKDNYILTRTLNDDAFAQKNNITVADLKAKKESWKKTLMVSKSRRKKPRLDDKTLTSWNALMLKAYLDAYSVFNEEIFLDVALNNAHFILKNQMTSDGKLFHNYKNGESSNNGFLEDYAATIDAFIKLYQITSNALWINNAEKLTQYTIDNFYDDNNKMFYYTSKEDPALVARTIEFRDNVIPASTSIMAKNLYQLSHYFGNVSYNDMAKAMLNNVKPEITNNASYFSNWLDLMLNYTKPYYEVVIVGPDAKQKFNDFNKRYIPNALAIYSETENDAPLLANRFVKGETFIYICVKNNCKLPVKTINEMLPLIDN